MTAAAEQNVLTFLSRAAERTPDRPALIFGDRDGDSLSFARLLERADRVSCGLRARGLRPGDRVIVMIPMSLELYAVLLGLLKLGAVAVFVDPWIGGRRIAGFSAFADPNGFIGVAKSHLLRLLSRRLRAIPLAITTGGRLLCWPARVTLDELESGAGDGAIHPVTNGDPALITFTSGSSGVPKGANRTHGFLAAQHAALKAEFPYADADVDMPMFPVFALNNLALGITSVVPTMDFRRVAEVDGRTILQQMRAHGVTTCTASPPFFDRLTGELKFSRNPPPLRRILTGGAPVSDQQLELWRHHFPDTEIVVVYGSTEAEPVAHITAEERLNASSDAHPETPGFCVGRPTSQVRARLVTIGSEEGGEVAPHAIGELLVSGDHVCRDYFRNAEAARENKILERDGTVWHRMGDTGYFDRSGRFWLVGRVHSTIVRGGALVHPQLVEQAVGTGDSRIRGVAAVGLPDADLGQRVVVALETSSGEEVRAWALKRLASTSFPVDDVVLLDEPLPVDPRHNSKIDYARLRARLLDGKMR